MNYKVTVVIDGRTYNLSTDVDDGYIERVASYVDREITGVTEATHASAIDAVTMTCMNIADGYFREHVVAENLRREVAELKALQEASAAQQEDVDALKQQLSEAVAQKEALQQQIADSSDLRAQLKRSQDECLRLRKEIVRMGKNS